MIGGTASVSQAATAYYYPAPGDYATTLGTVHIPAAGDHYNIPLLAVPGSSNLGAPRGPAFVSYPTATPGAFMKIVTTPSRIMIGSFEVVKGRAGEGVGWVKMPIKQS